MSFKVQNYKKENKDKGEKKKENNETKVLTGGKKEHCYYISKVI